MPVITFPKGPNTQEETEEETELQEGEVEAKVHYFYCTDCEGTVFHLYDDGEIECANPRCGGILSGLMVCELGNKDA